MNPLLLLNLNEFREWLGQPIYISSGFRCKIHNAKEGGVPKSMHLVGSAVDIFVKGLTGPQLYWKLLEWNPTRFKGIGIGATFIHVDQRTIPAIFFYNGLTLSKLHPDQVHQEEN